MRLLQLELCIVVHCLSTIVCSNSLVHAITEEEVIGQKAFSIKKDASFLEYLNPRIFEPAMLENIRSRLERGELVIIRGAFQEDFAEYVWSDLSSDDVEWVHNMNSWDSGFGYSHHNIYSLKDYTPIMTDVHNLFNHSDGKAFMQELSGRDCSGDMLEGSPSYYMPGDYSLPHTDFSKARSVAYVWHLSRDWNPDWGGSMYWLPETEIGNANVPASWNTLFLFSVTLGSSHFVSQVTKAAENKRLAFNGWFATGGIPSLSDDPPIEDKYATREEQLKLSYTQLYHILDMDMDEVEDEERWEKLVQLQEDLKYLSEFNDENPEPYFHVDLWKLGRKRRQKKYQDFAEWD